MNEKGVCRTAPATMGLLIIQDIQSLGCKSAVHSEELTSRETRQGSPVGKKPSPMERHKQAKSSKFRGIDVTFEPIPMGLECPEHVQNSIFSVIIGVLATIRTH